MVSEASRPAAVLVGPPGSGKTTVGRALAQRLGLELHDTDVAIEAATGRTIPDIFIEDGEPVFRDLERAEVARALTGTTGVLALGGGAVMDAATRAALAGHTVVFLDVGIADASKRIGFDQSRPLLAVNPRASWVAPGSPAKNSIVTVAARASRGATRQEPSRPASSAS